MELLLCIVEANAAAKALASVAAQSLHAVDDCSCIVECCTKVLPAALSALESAATTPDDVVEQAVECVQGCSTSMGQLQAALESLNGHNGEGVLGVLLEHPAAWLDTYRGFRGLLAQLLSVSCFVRTAAQRGHADDTEETLQESVKALMRTCTRARQAANLMGKDLPEFAGAAAVEGWSARRVRLEATATPAAATPATVEGSGSGSPCRRCGCRQGACVCGGGCAAAYAPAALLAAASATLHQHQRQQLPPSSHHQQQHQQQRMGLLRRISKAAALNSPVTIRVGRRSDCISGLVSPDMSSGRAGRLDDAACTLVARIQDLILYDSEVDQLEQDRAYLLQRVSHLQEFCCSSAATAAEPAAAEPAAAAAAAAAASVSLIQSEVLLAAVDSQLRALGERSDSSGEACQERLRKGDAVVLVGGGSGAVAAAASCSDGSRGGVMRPSRLPATSNRLVDPEDLYDDVRKRRLGLRWLPVCFVGA